MSEQPPAYICDESAFSRTSDLKLEGSYVPQFLYKIISLENWKNSKGQKNIVLSSDDSEFIHFSTDEQLDRILKKYWVNAADYVILTVETKKLSGRLAFEVNPGGTTSYYHLYDGEIPWTAVQDEKIINK